MTAVQVRYTGARGSLQVSQQVVRSPAGDGERTGGADCRRAGPVDSSGSWGSPPPMQGWLSDAGSEGEEQRQAARGATISGRQPTHSSCLLPGRSRDGTACPIRQGRYSKRRLNHDLLPESGPAGEPGRNTAGACHGRSTIRLAPRLTNNVAGRVLTHWPRVSGTRYSIRTLSTAGGEVEVGGTDRSRC